LAWLVGIATGAFGMIGMWRNVTSAVGAVAAANNYLLPAWMIGLGVWLALESRKNAAVVPTAGLPHKDAV
jgi:hypothetical protein